jgi:arginase
MDLALALGHGPAVLADLDQIGPLVQEAHVAVLGYRGDVLGYGALATKESLPTLLRLPLSEIKSQGASIAAQRVLTRFASLSCGGFWVHLDVDVLDDEVMPAVDSRQPDGMSYADLGDVLVELLRSPLAAGMDVTILDPDLDPNGNVIDRFATFMENLFASIPRTAVGSA